MNCNRSGSEMAGPVRCYREEMNNNSVAPVLYSLNPVNYGQTTLPWSLPNIGYSQRITASSSLQLPSDNLHVPLSINPLPLVSHPMNWSRSDVIKWLRWSEEEFSLNGIDIDKFGMNGKGLLMLTKQDFKDRASYVGDVLYEMLERLKRKDLYQSLPKFSPLPPISPTQHHHHATSPIHRSIHQSTYHQQQQQQQHQQQQQGDCRPDLTGMSSDSLDEKTIREVNRHHDNHAQSVIVQHIQSTEPLLSSPISTSNGSVCSDEDRQSTSPTMTGSDYEQNDREMKDESLPGKPDSDYNQSSPLDLSTISLPVKPNSDCRLLWEFLYCLLSDKTYNAYIKWEDTTTQTFRILKPSVIAYLWGRQKNRKNMTYDKLSRALRYYYKMNILQKEEGQKLTYRFLKKAEDLQPSPEYSKLKQIVRREDNVGNQQVKTELENEKRET